MTQSATKFEDLIDVSSEYKLGEYQDHIQVMQDNKKTHYYVKKRPVSQAFDEFAAQQFLSLMLPRQQETKLIFDKENKQPYIMSTRVLSISTSRLPSISPSKYGKQKYDLILSEVRPDDEEVKPGIIYLYKKPDGKFEYVLRDEHNIIQQHNPKATLRNKKNKTRTTIQEIIDRKPLTNTNKNNILKLCGRQSGVRGLGEINFYVPKILGDRDSKFRNILFGKDLFCYKIDSEEATFSQEVSPTPDQETHFSLLKNDVYNREVMKSILKFIVLPKKLIRIFTKSLSTPGIVKTKIEELSDKLADKQNFVRAQLLTLNKEELKYALLSPAFLDYCLTTDAIADLAEFKEHLKTFKTPQGNILLDQCPDTLKAIDDFFAQFCALIKKKKDDLLTTKEMQETLGLSDKDLLRSESSTSIPEETKPQVQAVSTYYKMTPGEKQNLQAIREYVQQLRKDNKIEAAHETSILTAASHLEKEDISGTEFITLKKQYSDAVNKVSTYLTNKEEFSCARALRTLLLGFLTVGLIFCCSKSSLFYKKPYQQEGDILNKILSVPSVASG